ncbi:hypothetical protein [Proteiniphilum sp. X52]|uniref:hypothetical protein n=1 Tax=Proteiniphilum sp. X52 TaxID=2382159 RepID=UPI0011CDF6C6|nr:hypothetical protein [Proteiniphilum sp. X52]
MKSVDRFVSLGSLLSIKMTGLFSLYIASRAAATDGVVSSGEKETIDCPDEDGPYNDTDDDNDEKLYIHAF